MLLTGLFLSISSVHQRWFRFLLTAVQSGLSGLFLLVQWHELSVCAQNWLKYGIVKDTWIHSGLLIRSTLNIQVMKTLAKYSRCR